MIREAERGRGQIAAASLHPTVHIARHVLVCRTMMREGRERAFAADDDWSFDAAA
jgi:hypothetical protein